jgi:hypothetical protein
VLLGHTTRPAQRRGYRKLMRERRRAREAGTLRDRLVLKRGRFRLFQPHCRKLMIVIENTANY